MNQLKTEWSERIRTRKVFLRLEVGMFKEMKKPCFWNIMTWQRGVE